MIDVPAAGEPEVSVVVVVTAGADRARACFAHIAAACARGPAIELVVVDNAARADARAVIRDELRGARVLVSEEDLGIPAAWRAAVSVARAPRVLVLHEDTELAPGTLPALMAAMDADPRVGAVAGRIHGLDGQVQSAGRVVWRDGHDAPVTSGARLDGDAPFAVDRPSSATMLVDRSAYDAAGGFDDAFFPAVCVDADFGLALWSAGAIVVCAPDAHVVHASGAMVQADGGPMRSGVFSHFLQQRAYTRLAAKWAGRLVAHPPAAAGVDAALDAVAARARQASGFTRSPTAPPRPGSPLLPGAPEPIPAAVQALAAARRMALRDAFLAWSVERDHVLHHEIAWRDDRLAELEDRTAFHAGYIEELSERIRGAAEYIQRLEEHAAALRRDLAAREG